MESRLEKIRRLRSRGFSITAISKLDGVSRQRIWQLLNDTKKDNLLSHIKLRTFIFTRDSHQCQWAIKCGDTINSLPLYIRKKKIFIHHIDGNHKNNVPKNMITLCAGCHAAFHHLEGKLGRERKTEYIGTIVGSKEYNRVRNAKQKKYRDKYYKDKRGARKLST